MMKPIYIHEMFESVQGEVPRVGRIARFIRLAGCSVGCPWCDTKPSWNRSDATSIPEVLKWACREGNNPSDIVITGGEPLEQPIALMELITGIYFLHPTAHVQIETSAAYLPDQVVDLLTMMVHFVISPKWLNRGDGWKWRCDLEAWAEMVREIGAGLVTWKFVIHRPDQIDDIKGLIRRHGLRNVFIMPGDNARLDIPALLAECSKDNLVVGISPRIHNQWGLR